MRYISIPLPTPPPDPLAGPGYSKTQKHFSALLIDADGLFSCLIRRDSKTIVIEVSYVKEYNRERKRRANFFILSNVTY